MVEDLDYLQWIREQPSIIKTKMCPAGAPPPSDPHHVWNTGKRRSGKINDHLAVPLTREEHTIYHSIGHKSFEERFNVDLEWEIIKLLSRYICQRTPNAREIKSKSIGNY